jgi:hypothetical protein
MPDELKSTLIPDLMKLGLLDYPCHILSRQRWCDHSGLGGFMGHTCLRRAKEILAILEWASRND